MQDRATPANNVLRYQRQMLLPEIGSAGQAKLTAARVMVVGAGGLGCPVLSYLAAAGIGQLGIVDSDLVELSNLHRQPLYPQSSVGKAKALEAARVLSELNPQISIHPFQLRIDAESVRKLLSGFDIIVDGSDNFATRYLLNDACVELGKTLVSGSVFRFEGQVSVFNAILPDGGRGPTYRCLFPEPPPPELVPSCAESGVLGVLPGIIGSLQAAEVLKLALGIGERLVGRLLVFDALSMSFSEVSFKRNEETAGTTKLQPAAYYQNLARTCPTGVKGISACELKRMLNDKSDLTLIDVREAFEKAQSDIGGELIPLAFILAETARIPRDRPVIVYCHSGIRSRHAILALEQDFGFNNLYNLEGGIVAWQKETDA